jgi:excinuclease UvrABC nuclease subunit
MCSADFDKQYKYGVKLAKRILSGHTRRVLSDLDKKMKAAAALQDFEEAAKIREQIQALQSTCAPAPQVAKIGK